MKRVATLALLGLAGSAGCSFQRMALDQTATILKKGMPAFEREGDYELAAAALPPNVKMIEGFLQTGPDSEDLLLMAAQAFTSYAMVVLEDRWESAEEDSPAAEELRLRAKNTYLRGYRYGLQLLELRHPGITQVVEKGREPELLAALAKMEPEDAVGLFWTGMPLGSAINLGRDDVQLISRLPKVKALVRRAVELDEAYYHAGSHMVLGAMKGSTAKMLGGEPEEARKHFERALSLTGRRFLLIHVMYATTLAVQLQDKALYKKLLDEVVHADLSIDPDQKLANVVAQRRARRALAKIDEMF
ncbi:MAG: hypothetical protein IT371_09205 [Deltaproteobacteria bacterium]|nr:hypothetical protein [Deltaproteobacteria bacterium]